MSSEHLERLVRGYVCKDIYKHGGRARVESVVSMILSDYPELRKQAREIAEIARRLAQELSGLSVPEAERILREEYPELLGEKEKTVEKKTLPPLPGALEGRVRLRFAPNPDFHIHLGNARPAIVSDEYAKMYRGTLILRFEDTDPRTKTPLLEAYDSIREDLRWLGVVWHEEYIQSLRLNVYYDVAREMLKRGHAYVDTCREKSRELLRAGLYCRDRDREAEWQLEQFDRMLEGAYGEGEAVVRVKTDPQHPNPSVRDWVALRIIDTEKYPHPLTGSKYRVWPTYNFAVAIDDYLMNVTHVIRGKEHEVNTEKQLYVYKAMGWSTPHFIHVGRLKLEGFILSKSKIRELLSREKGRFLGYDDPRFGTIASLRRRGVTPEAIRELILTVGVREVDAKISWENLAAINRKIVDRRADRVMFVWNPVELEYDGPCFDAEVPYHPDDPSRKKTIGVCGGDRIYISGDDASLKEFRLMGGVNVRVEDGRAVFVSRELDYARSRRLQIIQWVPDRGKVDLTVLEPSGLDLIAYRGYAEPALREYKTGARLQLVRFAFVVIDSVSGDSYTAILTHR
ncbi:MAG: glutamate--tRNA ligase [Acidilobaceae archaeon]